MSIITAVRGRRRQPVTDPLDLSLSDAEILEHTEQHYASEPDFKPIEQWREAFAQRLEEA